MRKLYNVYNENKERNTKKLKNYTQGVDLKGFTQAANEQKATCSDKQDSNNDHC